MHILRNLGPDHVEYAANQHLNFLEGKRVHVDESAPNLLANLPRDQIEFDEDEPLDKVLHLVYRSIDCPFCSLGSIY